MSVSPSPAIGAADPGRGRVEQLYVTSCHKQDSVQGQPGYSIRATSIDAPELFQFALEFPALRLPLDMRATTTLPPRQAPQRLALVPAPRDKLALVNTAYLPL